MKNIYFQNETALREKIAKIKREGLSKLHIVSDSDRTLTKYFVDGKKIPSSIALIREGNYLTKDYAKKAFALYDKYSPIEIDESLDFDYRVSKMKEWWETHRDLLVKSGMRKEIIDNIIYNFPKMFREGFFDFLDTLHKNNVPLLIFSAGIGNIIEGSLKKFNKLTSNVHILSNNFDFDEKGFARGYKNEVIHTLNKSETKIEDEKYKKLVSQRKNVILLGDSIGDLGMVDDKNCDTIIKIGFLNGDIEKNLELYVGKFDVVITNDGTLEYVNKILSEIQQEKSFS